MHIVLISGSHRPVSQSQRIATYLAQRLTKQNHTTDIISLGGNPLPLWDEGAWQSESATSKQWQPYADRLKTADGLVLVAPEWAGMVPAGLKNFLLYCSPQIVGHKPTLLVGVSAGINGAYPVAELRSSGYKNAKLLYLPDHLIVRTAEKMLQGETAADSHDQSLRDRIEFSLRNLTAYAEALKPLRDSGVLFDERYAFGM